VKLQPRIGFAKQLGFTSLAILPTVAAMWIDLHWGTDILWLAVAANIPVLAVCSVLLWRGMHLDQAQR